MSARVKHYYACDYCETEIDKNNKAKAYTDNMKYLNKTFDICGEECLKKHLNYIEKNFIKVENIEERIDEKSIEEYQEKYIKPFWC